MLYVLAVIGAISVAMVAWHLLRTDQAHVPADREQPRPSQQQRRVIGPDDDPEFLRSLEDRGKDV